MDELDKTLCDISTLLLVQDDVETLKKIAVTVRDPIISMLLVPYYALFCKSVHELIQDRLLDEEKDNTIAGIRNSLKNFTKKYGKLSSIYTAIDNEQDRVFRSKISFGLGDYLDIHYNLGIYFTQEKKIIGNTHLVAAYYDGFNSNEGLNQIAYSIGYDLGSIIGSVSTGIASKIKPREIDLNYSNAPFFYLDINTNNNGFFCSSINKTVNLLLLHILSQLNFIQYCIEPILLPENTWLLRMKYISTYYAYRGVERIVKHMTRNGIKNDFTEKALTVLQTQENLFNPVFRNCTMHYSLDNHGTFAIKKEYYNVKKPFHGLVESCFDGLSYQEFFQKLSEYGKRLEVLISESFTVDETSLKIL